MTTKIDGTLGITFPDSSVQSTAALSIGVSQTWQNMIAQRGLNISYPNNTGKPIMISIQAQMTQNQYLDLVVGSVSVSYAGFSSNPTGAVGGTVSAIVPNGVSYIVNSTGVSSGLKWAELR